MWKHYGPCSPLKHLLLCGDFDSTYEKWKNITKNQEQNQNTLIFLLSFETLQIGILIQVCLTWLWQWEKLK